jgi:ribonuclease R
MLQLQIIIVRMVNMTESIMEERKNKILEFMRDHSYKPLLFSELSVVLDVPSDDRPVFQALLDSMVRDGLIIKTRKERYGVPEP